MKKNLYILFLILVIYSIIPLKTIATKKNIQDKLILDNQLKFYSKELITKKNTKKWLQVVNSHMNYYERKFIINKDYLKLIKIFPNNKNIKSEEINKNLKKYKKIISGDLKLINELKNLYKSLGTGKIFYIVIYDLKFLNLEKSEDKHLKLLTLCSLNSNYEKEMIIFRKNLPKVFQFLAHEGFERYKSSFRERDDLRLSPSNIDNIVCNKFKKKNLIFNKNNKSLPTLTN